MGFFYKSYICTIVQVLETLQQMNESILQALMKMFALVANVNEEGQASTERDIVIEFLQKQFSNELVENYIEYFDRHVVKYHSPGLENKADSDKFHGTAIERRLKELCDQLNEELQREQKIIVLINLLDYINEDKKLTRQELAFVDHAAVYLKVELSEFNDLKAYTFERIDEIVHKENLLLINSQKKIGPKIKHLYNERLEGIILVLHIVSTNTFVMRYKGNETLLLNGHNIRTNRNYIWYPGSVLKNPKAESIYYTWISGKFIQSKAKSKFIFTAKNIEFSYGNSPNGLKRFTLTEESGRLIGIIGGSGSGKSTLLKVLCGNLKPKRGSIAINGLDIHTHHEEQKGLIGYVPQDDFLIKELTTFQNLYYNAKLCFGNYSEEKILKVAEDSLIDFDLFEARGLRVGDSQTTYLSGGQRKRLNIALELMREPAILFVDEPTSGLSSADTEKVMYLLKRQTFKGKLIFANIHQPSSDIFKLLDKLLVMDQGGRVIYYGNPVDAIGYFKRMSNFVDVEESECLTCGNINTDQILRNVEARVVDVNGRLTRKRKTSPEEWYEMYMTNIDPIIRRIKRSFTSVLPTSDFSIPKKIQQLRIFFTRDILAKLENRQYLLLTLLEAPVLALILAFFTRSSRDMRGQTESYLFGENPNIPGFLFMSIIVALFLGLVISAEEIFRDRKLLNREKFLNLSRSSYLNAKILVLIIISAVQTLLFVAVATYILEIRGMEWRYFLILFTSACWANLIGLNISSGFNSVVTIYILVPLILVPQLLFSGVVIDFRNMNDRIKTEKYVPLIGDIITSRWAYEALMVTQYIDNRFERMFFEYDSKLSNSAYIKSYVIPELRSLGDESLLNLKNNRNYSQTGENLRILKNELVKIAQKTAINAGEIIDGLNLEHFSKQVNDNLNAYLNRAAEFATGEYRRATAGKEGLFEDLIGELGGVDNFVKFKQKYYNKKLASIVLEENEILEFRKTSDELVQIKDPVYRISDSKIGRSQFYAPAKLLGNLIIDTFWFNIIRIWLSVFFLYVVLYFNLLKKLISYIENIRLRRFARRRFLRILK